MAFPFSVVIAVSEVVSDGPSVLLVGYPGGSCIMHWELEKEKPNRK